MQDQPATSAEVFKLEASLSSSLDYLASYREYTSHAIAPRLYSEWAGVISIASVLNQQCWIERGFYRVFPNLYVMLIGDPASGKGTTCEILRNILMEAEFIEFAPDRTTKEKFLVDLEEGYETVNAGAFPSGGTSAVDDFFKTEIRKTSPTDIDSSVSNVLVLAEELSDFFGSDNLEFVSLLTKLWSYRGAYRHKIKTGKSVEIVNPNINIFAATTHDSFQLTFPSRLLGTGFLARFILVYGSIPASAEIAFPTPPSNEGKTKLVRDLMDIRSTVVGQFELDDAEKLLLERVLKNYTGPDDMRFKHYKGRRFVQLLKLCAINCAARGSMKITRADILRANTLLYATELDMGKALGEFGKSRNAEVSNKIMQALYTAGRPMNALAIFKLVSNDIQKMQELLDILNNLQAAEKIRAVQTPDKKNNGFIAISRPAGLEGTLMGKGEDSLIDGQYLNYLMG